MEIILPPQINATGLLPLLSLIGAEPGNEVIINFAQLRRVSPAGLAALAATTARWRKEHVQVIFNGLEECPITGYLQRMNLLEACHEKRFEDFRRHDARGRFVPLQPVDVPVESMGDMMSACLAPGGDNYGHSLASLYDFAYYVLTETANNVRQHSGGTGFAAAQVTQAEGFVRMAIADNGRGIRQSFIDAGFSWAPSLDDVDAIRTALQPLISSKGTPTNEGVGLTLVSALARLTKAWLLIVSGRGLVRILPDGRMETAHLPAGGVYFGTLVGLTFKRIAVGDFAELLTEAKVRTGLLPTAGAPGKFTA